MSINSQQMKEKKQQFTNTKRYIKSLHLIPQINSAKHFFIYLFFGSVPGGTQRLLLALNSKITPGTFRGPHGMAGIEIRLAACKDNT